MYSLDGGSFDLQLGGESTDVVLLVMDNPGVDALSCVRSCSSIATFPPSGGTVTFWRPSS
jgi:hypothetical protein